ncbi:MAG TPA: NUDIX hydrolase [Candidatus Saccharimonadales bacterium]|nr:NUDIX hydrolase [Candidatus Saccharimonadales bacterium]
MQKLLRSSSKSQSIVTPNSMLTHVVAKTLIFNEEGKVLLLTRSSSDEHRPGGLDLPGGRVEDGEEILAGAVREADEESGLIINASNMHWVYADTVSTYNTDVKGNVNLIRVTFAARVESPNVTLSHEHDAFGWYTLGEAIEVTKGTRYPTVLKYMMQHNIAKNLWRQQG